MKKLILSGLFFSSLGFEAQNRMSLGFDAGAVINKPLIVHEHFSSNLGTGSDDFTYDYYTSTGSYYRASLDLKSKNRGNWQFIMPVYLTYMKHVSSYHIKGSYNGCFARGNYDETRTTSSNYILSSVGFGAQYHTDIWRHALTFNLNSIYTLNSKIKTVDIDGTTTISTDPYTNLATNFSGQFQSLFKLHNKIWIGPTLEVHFYELRYTIYAIKNKIDPPNHHYHRDGAYYGLQGQQIWINPGVKIQWDLK